MAAHTMTERRADVRAGYRELGAALPDVMAQFGALHRAATGDGALPKATKELISLAIGIAAQCDGCIVMHVHDAIAAGATREQVVETIGVAILMGGGPASVAAIEAVRALDEFASPAGPAG